MAQELEACPMSDAALLASLSVGIIVVLLVWVGWQLRG